MNEDLRATLLGALASRIGAGAGSSPAELLAHLGTSDPTVGLIAQYLAERREVGAESEPPAAGNAAARPATGLDVAGTADERSAEAAALRALRRKIETLYVELEELRARNDALAAALGACYLCWGDDPECPVCGGSGGPGAASPDRRLFTELIAPAVRALRPRGEVERRAGAAVPRASAEHKAE